MKNSDSNILYQQKNNNILYKILENKQKTDFNFKKILKIKNFFIYFAELRKLYIAYKKNLKNLEQKISIEKYTFYPTINKNNNILLHKYPPSMSFLERNDLIRSKNLQKMKILEDERRNELLKECTFKPFGNNKKIKIDPIEISNRLYYNSRSKKKKHSNTNITEKTSRDNSKNNSLNKTNKKIIKKRSVCKSKILKKYNMSNMSNNCTKKQNTNNNINNHNLRTNIPKSKNININSIHNSKEEDCYDSTDNNKKNKMCKTSSSPPHSSTPNGPLEPLDDKELLAKKRAQYSNDTSFKQYVNNSEKNKNKINKILHEEYKGGEGTKVDKSKGKKQKDNYKNYNNELNNKLLDEPLFIVEIKIKNEIKMIEIHLDDAPEKVVYDFCNNNHLGEASYEKICLIINNKLNEIKDDIYQYDKNNDYYVIENKKKHYFNEDNKIEEIEEEEE